MRFAFAGLLALALAACGDADPIAPPSVPAAPTGAPAGAPLRDALERIAPTLGSGPAAVDLRGALTAAVAEPTADALAAVESALLAVEAEQPDVAVEADVMRLAVAAQR